MCPTISKRKGEEGRVVLLTPKFLPLFLVTEKYGGKGGSSCQKAMHPRVGLAEGKSFLATSIDYNLFACCPDPMLSRDHFLPRISSED